MSVHTGNASGKRLRFQSILQRYEAAAAYRKGPEGWRQVQSLLKRSWNPRGENLICYVPQREVLGGTVPSQIAGAAGWCQHLAHFPWRAHWEDCSRRGAALPVAAGHSVLLPCLQNQPFSSVSSCTAARTSVFAGTLLSPHPRPLLPYLANECWEKKQTSPSAVNGRGLWTASDKKAGKFCLSEIVFICTEYWNTHHPKTVLPDLCQSTSMV